MIGGGFFAAKKRLRSSSFNHLGLNIELAIVKIVFAAWCPCGEAV
jgi:hypothetical protein